MYRNFLLMVLMLSVGGSWAAETLPPVSREDWAGRYYAELTAKAASLQGSTVPVVFLGDSITHAWAWKSDVKYPGGREVWDTALAEFKPLNLGVSGDTVPNLLWRVTEGKQLDGYQARVIVLIPNKNQIGLFNLDCSDFLLYGMRGAFPYSRQTRSISWANQDLGLS